VVVKYNITIFVFISSLLVSGVSCATELKGSEVVKLATLNYKHALDDYEKQLKYCSDKSDKKRIDRAVFKNIKLTQLQLQIAIGRFHFIALDKCESEKFGAYLIQRGIYRETVKKFNTTFDSDNPIYYDDLEVFGSRYRHIDFEIKYLRYPKSERDKLENIPELKQLFHMLSAIGV